MTPPQSHAASDLETAFGDPYASGNPFGYEPITRADERAEIFEGGELLLDALGANAEFVPRALGGRLDTVDALVRRLRPVFRRDAALGLGYGVSSFMAALNVWLGGNDAQRQSLAVSLLAGTRMSLAHREPAHRHDVAAPEFTAGERGGRFVVDGRNGLVINAGRAHSAVIVARTGDVPRQRSHSLLLVDLAALPPMRWHRLPRVHTLGIRGCQLGGLAFTDCAVPAGSLVGELGEGADIARRSCAVSGCVVAGLALGMLDAGLFTVLRFAVNRRLYGRSVAEIPHARAVIAGAFADLLAVDCLVTTATRALHLLPGNGVYAAATKYLAPLLLEDAMNELSVVLGARYYLREGEHAIFGKHFRDLPALSIAYADGIADEMAMLRHLPALARALDNPSEAPSAVFEQDVELPPLVLGDPRPDTRAGDPLLTSLALYLRELSEETAGDTDVTVTANLLLAELEKLVAGAGEIPTWQQYAKAGPDSRTQTERYATLLAASACLGVWRHNRHRRVLAGTAWVRTALRRLLGRLVPGTPRHPAHLDEELFRELLTRTRNGSGFCLDEDPVVRGLPC